MYWQIKLKYIFNVDIIIRRFLFIEFMPNDNVPNNSTKNKFVY